MDATLTRSGSTYVYTRRGATTFVFDVATGHLLSLQDQAGAQASTPYRTTPAYWGTVSSHTGTTTTALLYGGGYTDTTGLIYLRARYYDPTTGIFLTIDPALTTTAQPYLYAGDNPTNRIDPSGLSWLGVSNDNLMAVGLIIGLGALDTIEEVGTLGIGTPAVIAEDIAITAAVEGTEEVAAGAAEIAPEGISVFRTPRLGAGETELANGLDPTRFTAGDQSAYVGDEAAARNSG